ncbi:MAG: glycosyltransferase family 2 protein [Sediminibacterium sp.]|nr:glycosyltransferase family 2 protein [Sediminibacterium sp.]
MKISGFTIIKNAIRNDYPVVEAIRSILPVVDEMIVLVGESEDDTLGLIQSINDPKIRIHHSVWDKNLRHGGNVLAVETNKALKLIDKESTWAFYIQGDELVHEQYHAAIRQACMDYADDPKVQGLLFRYLHFYGSYDYVGDSRQWYLNEVRVIRNDPAITAYKDAQGFRIGKKKLWVKRVEAYVYHYGFVKTPEQMKQKIKNVSRFWHPDDEIVDLLKQPDYYDFENEFDSLQKFTGTHPAVMQERKKRFTWTMNPDLSKKRLSFKDRLLYKYEKLTGVRLFDFRNYKILR